MNLHPFSVEKGSSPLPQQEQKLPGDFRRKMEFKLFLLCFAVLVAATAAGTVCKCVDKEIMKDPVSRPVAKYTLKMNKGGKDYDEQVEVDIERETETFRVPKTSPDEEAGEIVYDFKKNMTMVHLPATNSCFLSDSTDDVPKPAALVKLLGGKDGQVEMPRKQTEVKLKVVGTLKDRSKLSDEMTDLCEKLPIYFVVEGEVDSTAAVQPTKTLPARRSKRNLVRRLVCRIVCSIVCHPVCSRICAGWFGCRTVCYPVCSNVCRRVCEWIWVTVG